MLFAFCVFVFFFSFVFVFCPVFCAFAARAAGEIVSRTSCRHKIKEEGTAVFHTDVLMRAILAAAGSDFRPVANL